MKKFLYKLMGFAAILAVAALFFIDGPAGRPILSIEDFKPAVPEILRSEPVQEPATVYKWQDENGVWQFSNNPEDAEGAQQLEYDGKINTMQALEVVPATQVSAAPAGVSQPGLLPTDRFEAALDTMNKAQELQETIDRRKSDLDAALKRESN